jgi:hypothetical protein
MFAHRCFKGFAFSGNELFRDLQHQLGTCQVWQPKMPAELPTRVETAKSSLTHQPLRRARSLQNSILCRHADSSALLLSHGLLLVTSNHDPRMRWTMAKSVPALLHRELSGKRCGTLTATALRLARPLHKNHADQSPQLILAQQNHFDISLRILPSMAVAGVGAAGLAP